MLHPNEMVLVQRAASGVIIPARDYKDALADAMGSKAKLEALTEQVNRQKGEL